MIDFELGSIGFSFCLDCAFILLWGLLDCAAFLILSFYAGG